jgi:hypothetical protein
MIEIDTYKRRMEAEKIGGSIDQNLELPQKLLTFFSQEQADTFVKEVRHEFWVEIRPREHGLANAYASMNIADQLFSIAPINHPEYSPEQIAQAKKTIELGLDARERLMKNIFNHLDRPADLWADEVIEELKKNKQVQENVIFMASRLPTNIKRGPVYSA